MFSGPIFQQIDESMSTDYQIQPFSVLIRGKSSDFTSGIRAGSNTARPLLELRQVVCGTARKKIPYFR
jgi:hypothetical protein